MAETPLEGGAMKCSPGNQRGLHGVVLTNCGGMGDGELCLRCGLEYYPTFAPPMRAEVRREIIAPDDWPAMGHARSLPCGLMENRYGKDDKDWNFDRLYSATALVQEVQKEREMSPVKDREDYEI